MLAQRWPAKGLGPGDGRLHALYGPVLSAALLLRRLQLLPQEPDLPLQLPDPLLLSPVSVHLPGRVGLVGRVVVIGGDGGRIVRAVSTLFLLLLLLIFSQVRGQRQTEVGELDLRGVTTTIQRF